MLLSIYCNIVSKNRLVSKNWYPLILVAIRTKHFNNLNNCSNGWKSIIENQWKIKKKHNVDLEGKGGEITLLTIDKN